jgi:predicted GNAT family acetyltransferase
MENQTPLQTASADLIADIFNQHKEATEPKVETPIVETPKPEDAPLPEKPITDEVKPEPVKAPKPKPESNHTKKLRGLIEDGFIENFSINYDGQDVYLDEIQDLTAEGYKEILDGWKAETEKQKAEKYISTEGVSERARKLLEIDKAGGDITEIIRENVTAINQLEYLKENIDQEQVQINVVGNDLQQKGISQKVIQAQIQAFIEEGELENQAHSILDGHLTLHNDAIEQKRQGESERVIQEKNEQKEFKRALEAKYAEMNVPKNIAKQIIENATKLDEYKISNTDKLYFEAQKDPELFAEINYFLNNRDAFKKQFSAKEVLQTKLDGRLKPLFTVNIGNTKKAKATNDSLTDYAQEIINSNK